MQKKAIIDVYNEEIVTKIKEIDIIMKTGETVSVDRLASILNISNVEIQDILNRIGEKVINFRTILQIMVNGSGLLCKIVKREIDCGSPHFYTPENLSYIYDIDYEKIVKVYKSLNIKTVTTEQIPSILVQIQ